MQPNKTANKTQPTPPTVQDLSLSTEIGERLVTVDVEIYNLYREGGCSLNDRGEIEIDSIGTTLLDLVFKYNGLAHHTTGDRRVYRVDETGFDYRVSNLSSERV